jgi:hypothetical protein
MGGSIEEESVTAPQGQQAKGLIKRLAKQWMSGQVTEDEAVEQIATALSVPSKEARRLLRRAAGKAGPPRPIQSEAWEGRGVHPFDTGAFP